ncbi:MAG: toll/interleukin-1 receptor domain-containing protein [Bryobacteraceae bacterium]
MGKPRIFISHSAREQDTDSVLRQISEQLKSDGYEVLLDRESLREGTRWREQLYNWMNYCHGAIVLYSPAALESDFVPIEVSVLTSRRHIDPRFIVQTVLMKGFDRSELESGIWKSLEVNAYQQMSQASEEKASQISQELSRSFQRLKTSVLPKTPLDRMALRLRSLISSVASEVLEDAASELVVPAEPWDSRTDVHNAFVTAMLGADLVNLHKALRRLRDNGADADKTREIYELLAPSWIDYRAAQSLHEVAVATGGRPSVATTGQFLDFTPSMFVRRACCRPIREAWPVKEVPCRSSDNPEGYYSSRVKIALLSLAKLEVTEHPERDESEIQNWLYSRRRLNEPVIIAMAWPGPGPNTLIRLRERYQGVTFFLLTPTQRPDAPVFSEGHLRFLEPPIDFQREQDAKQLCGEIENILKGDN